MLPSHYPLTSDQICTLLSKAELGDRRTYTAVHCRLDLAIPDSGKDESDSNRLSELLSTFSRTISGRTRNETIKSICDLVNPRGGTKPFFGIGDISVALIGDGPHQQGACITQIDLIDLESALVFGRTALGKHAQRLQCNKVIVFGSSAAELEGSKLEVKTNPSDWRRGFHIVLQPEVLSQSPFRLTPRVAEIVNKVVPSGSKLGSSSQDSRLFVSGVIGSLIGMLDVRLHCRDGELSRLSCVMLGKAILDIARAVEDRRLYAPAVRKNSVVFQVNTDSKDHVVRARDEFRRLFGEEPEEWALTPLSAYLREIAEGIKSLK